MTKDECKARLHLLGFETTNETINNVNLKPEFKSKHVFVFEPKQVFVGYVILINSYSLPNYFTYYEQMIDKALKLNNHD